MDKVVIVGAGPAGLFTAYKLSKNKSIEIYILDKGKDIYKRFCAKREGKMCIDCKPCNIMCGFGGAGTFSDCKLSLSPIGVGGNIVGYVGEKEAKKLAQKVNFILARFDKDRFKRKTVGKHKTHKYKSIEKKLNSVGLNLTYNPTKHLGTDGTLEVMKKLYEYLLNKGVHFIFDCEVTDVVNSARNWSSNTLKVNYKLKNKEDYLFARFIILAPGRSGNSWLSNLADRLKLEKTSNGFDVGFRVELPAKCLKELTDNLYDMKINLDCGNGMSIRTFCVNPMGYVSIEHYDEGIVLANGHSYANKKSEYTNFALLVHFPNVSLDEGKSFLKEYNDHRQIKRYQYKDINTDEKLASFDLSRQITKYTTNFLEKLRLLYDINDIYLNAFEAKFYSDSVVVKENFETNIPGLYAIGDGAGITRGIIQAASTGLVVADDILKKLK